MKIPVRELDFKKTYNNVINQALSRSIRLKDNYHLLRQPEATADGKFTEISFGELLGVRAVKAIHKIRSAVLKAQDDLIQNRVRFIQKYGNENQVSSIEKSHVEAGKHGEYKKAVYAHFLDMVEFEIVRSKDPSLFDLTVLSERKDSDLELSLLSRGENGNIVINQKKPKGGNEEDKIEDFLLFVMKVKNDLKKEWFKE